MALIRNSADNLLYLRHNGYDMSNETKSPILNFAEKHHDFNIDDLFESLSKSMNINSRLFRYSSRRKIKDELFSILNNLNLI